ncbi:sensor histidine kinase [Glutamicibacter creatinolyticus]|uniref:sensor histidine kinase n=1 Tax=Glutamicibacter creatinolyticus TaxID=162496 RepID=UPI003216F41C
MPAVPGLPRAAGDLRRLNRDAWTFAARIFAVQMLLVLIAVLALAWFGIAHQRTVILQDRRDLVTTVSLSLAGDPFVRSELAGKDPATRLQPFTTSVLEETSTIDFITIMTPEGVRLTHPDPRQLGGTYLGTIPTEARSHVEQFTGTLGPSVRAIAPVNDEQGRTLGWVAVGVTVANLENTYRSQLPKLLGPSAVVLALGAASSWWFSKYIQRATLGFGPHGLRRLYAFYFSALHSVREGLLLMDRTQRVVLYNDEAARLLGLPATPPPDGFGIEQLGVPESLRELLSSARSARDEIHVTASSVVAVSKVSARATQPELLRGRRMLPLRWLATTPFTGVVVTLRDLTEVQEMTGEIQSLKTFATALRAQTHEHANRLHTIATLIENGREQRALDFALADRQGSQALTDLVVGSIDDAYLSSLLVAKAAQAHERGVRLEISASGTVPPDCFKATDLITIVGNLLDNALDVSVGSDAATVWVEVVGLPDELLISVADSGPGIEPEFLKDLMRFGVSTKGGQVPRGLGLALVQQAVLRLGGSITVDNDAGAIFTVTLPLPAAHGTAGTAGTAGTESSTKDEQ